MPLEFGSQTYRDCDRKAPFITRTQSFVMKWIEKMSWNDNYATFASVLKESHWSEAWHAGFREFAAAALKIVTHYEFSAEFCALPHRSSLVPLLAVRQVLVLSKTDREVWFQFWKKIKQHTGKRGLFWSGWHLKPKDHNTTHIFPDSARSPDSVCVIHTQISVPNITRIQLTAQNMFRVFWEPQAATDWYIAVSDRQ